MGWTWWFVGRCCLSSSVFLLFLFVCRTPLSDRQSNHRAYPCYLNFKSEIFCFGADILTFSQCRQTAKVYELLLDPFLQNLNTLPLAFSFSSFVSYKKGDIYKLAILEITVLGLMDSLPKRVTVTLLSSISLFSLRVDHILLVIGSGFWNLTFILTIFGFRFSTMGSTASTLFNSLWNWELLVGSALSTLPEIIAGTMETH